MVVLEPFFRVSPDKEPRKVDPAKTTVGPCWIMKTKAEVTGWGLNKAKSIKHIPNMKNQHKFGLNLCSHQVGLPFLSSPSVKVIQSRTKRIICDMYMRIIIKPSYCLKGRLMLEAPCEK